MRKPLVAFLLVMLAATGVMKSQTAGTGLTDVILKSYEPKMMTSKPVTDSQVELVLKCGLKSPSARNRQPWKFTVVKDKALLADIIPDFTPGNVLIIISGQESPPEGSNVDIDCALATAYMYIGAQSLGLGGHIYGGPVNNVNLNKRSILGIPEGYKAITLLRIGNVEGGVDAVSAASTRKSLEEIVNFR